MKKNKGNKFNFRSISPSWGNNSSVISFEKQTDRLDITKGCISPHESRFELPKLPQINKLSKMKKYLKLII